jgi:hypothetical protein
MEATGPPDFNIGFGASVSRRCPDADSIVQFIATGRPVARQQENRFLSAVRGSGEMMDFQRTGIYTGIRRTSRRVISS